MTTLKKGREGVNIIINGKIFKTKQIICITQPNDPYIITCKANIILLPVELKGQ